MFEDERALGATFNLEDIGWIDFETRAIDKDIKCGTAVYTQDAEAIVCAWAIGDSPVQLMALNEFKGALAWSDMLDDFKQFHAEVQAGNKIWAAWNANFDRNVWNYATAGFPELQCNQIIDVMAQAVASGLAPDLAQAAKQSFSTHKVESGKDLIKLFCTTKSEATPQSHPDQWSQFLTYAAGDIEAMRSVFLGTRQLSEAEWYEYWAMEAVNDRGIAIDMDMVKAAAKMAHQDKARARSEIFALTKGKVPSVDHVKPMVGWLLDKLPPTACEILTKSEEETNEDGEVVKVAKYSLTRKRIELLLAWCKGKNLPDVERILQIRRYGGSKTPAKFEKMLFQHVDGMLYNQYVFNGASQTGRASSRGVQIHNLARDTLDYEHEAIEALLNDIDYNNFAKLGDGAPVSRKLSLLIRPAFVPRRPDHVFVWSDWSQIEARILPWLAGDESRLDIFRAVDADASKPDLYTITAAELSRLPIAEVTRSIRQGGKIAELALGYGGGIGALQNMAAGYGIYLDDIEAKRVVERWRKVNGWCVRFWEQLETAIDSALQSHDTPFTVGRVSYVYLSGYLGGSLLCVLPSGRILTYRDIRYENVPELNDDGEVIGRSVQLRFSRGYGRVKLWRGLACENVVQAVAADVLRSTLRRLEDEEFDVRLHTHDEILVEGDANHADELKAELRYVMLQGFDWSKGLPLMSQETVAPYYTKRSD